MNDRMLLLLHSVTNAIDEAASLIDCACVEFTNCKTQSVANILGSLEAHGRIGHQDAKQPRPNWLLRHTQEPRSRRERRVALPSEFAVREIAPSARWIQSHHTSIIEVRILNPHVFSERFSPQNSHRVNRHTAWKFNHNPLRMKVVVVAGVVRVEIRIALPERI